MKSNKKKKKGFTLIELIAVIAILGILAAFLVPNITGYTNKAKVTKVKSDAKLMLNMIRTVRAESDDATIDTYAEAVAEDANLALSKAPNDAFQALTDAQLQTIIDSTATGFAAVGAGGPTGDAPGYLTYYSK